MARINIKHIAKLSKELFEKFNSDLSQRDEFEKVLKKLPKPMNPVIKKQVQLNAEIKTMADYALILEHCNGYDKHKSRKFATEADGEPLYEKLLARNLELFATGQILIN